MLILLCDLNLIMFDKIDIKLNFVKQMFQDNKLLSFGS